MADYGYSQSLVPENPLSLDKIVTYHNVAEHLDEDYLKAVGIRVIQDLQADLNSRTKWEEKNAKQMELALQICERKSWPWEGASNVKFPLLTIAALQYHARAYPALIEPNEIVKYQVFGNDPDGVKDTQGRQIGQHMTYQLTEEDEGWEDHMDRVLIIQPIVGCAFKKSYYDPVQGHNISELVLPDDLVVDYYTKSLETAPRVSHLIAFSQNDVHERVTRGLWLGDADDDDQIRPQTQVAKTQLEVVKEKSQGTQAGQADLDAPIKFVEQHRWLDLDDDGYKEPYIVVVNRATSEVVRIVARFQSPDIERKGRDVVCIKAACYFTKFGFVPSPDGGFYDIGFGSLLYPINESINSIINQLVDAGTLANLGGGFLGRGVKMKGGAIRLKPGEWQRIESTGDDLAKNIFKLPVPEPSAVLFQLLSLLISYGERVCNATDQVVGITPDQNTPAETSRNAMEQGMKVFTGIFKRTYRSLKAEFRKLYTLNSLFLSDDTTSNPFGITRQAYTLDPKGIRPAADPNVMSDGMRLQQANVVAARAATVPGYDTEVAERRVLEAYRIPGIDKLYPGPKKLPPQPSPDMLKQQNEQAKTQIKAKDLERKTAEGQFKIKAKIAELMQKAESIQAEIRKDEAQAAKLNAEAQDVHTGKQLAMVNAQLAVSKAKHQGMMDSVQLLHDISHEGRQLDHDIRQENANGDTGGVG